MKRELTRPAIVESFKKSINNLNFIDTKYHTVIFQQIDELCGNQTRFEKAKIAGNLWKRFFTDSMKAITNNQRGIPELCRFVDEMIEYEDILFTLDPHHREHIIHSIWVMLLGFYLKEQCQEFNELNHLEALSIFTKSDASIKDMNLARKRLDFYELPIWCLTSLTHDLGYPIQKTKAANIRMAKMMLNYGFLNLKDFEYTFTTIHQPAMNALLNTLSSRFSSIGGDNYKMVSSPGYQLDAAKSFERLDHGIMSAYLLQSKLDWICENFNLPSNMPNINLSIEDIIQPCLIVILLKALSSHTNSNYYADTLNSMSELLFLCDELEEFSRYCRSDTTHDWVEVQRRTELELEKGLLKMTYTFQDTEKNNITEKDDIRFFFNSKADKIQKRYELSLDGIKEIVLSCKDVTKADNILCTFNWKYGSEPVRECMIGGKKQDLLLI